MPKYINADKLVEQLKEWERSIFKMKTIALADKQIEWAKRYEFSWDGVDSARKLVLDMMKASDANVVEVVRCKDCKHWETKDYCRKIQLNGFDDPDFYCGYGVKKNDKKH